LGKGEKQMKTKKLYYENMYLASCKAKIVDITDEGIVTDETVAFAEGGGQVGDIGLIVKNGVEIPFFDTIKGLGMPLIIQDFPLIQIDTPVIHKVDPKYLCQFSIGDKITIKIDISHRIKTTLNHSAIHLALMAAKKQRPDITEFIKGCSITTDSARLDFSSQDRFSDEDMEKINNEVAKLIKDDLSIETFKHKNIEEAWDWKCGDFVIPCGGTHVSKTSMIGNAIVKRRTKGKGIERMLVFVSGGLLDINHYKI
jgi:alanyl-tRNA synthetase